MTKTKFLAVFLALTLTACAGGANPPQTTIDTVPPAGKALITISRSTDLLYFAVPARVDLNGMRSASLSRGETFATVVDPGQITITTDAWSAPGRSTIRFNTQPDKHYRIEISPNGGAMWSGAALGLVGQAMEGNGPFQLIVRSISGAN